MWFRDYEEIIVKSKRDNITLGWSSRDRGESKSCPGTVGYDINFLEPLLDQAQGTNVAFT